MTKPKTRDERKKHFIKGVKYLAFGIPLIVLTTYILTFAFLNKEVLPLYLILPLGIIAMAATLYVLFKGLRIVLDAVFN